MKRLILILISLGFFALSSYASDILKLRYSGVRIESYSGTEYDSSGGIIHIDLDSRNIKIYLGPNKIFFNACPIYYKTAQKASITGWDKAQDEGLNFNGCQTINGESCSFFINLVRKLAVFKMENNTTFTLHFEGLITTK